MVRDGGEPLVERPNLVVLKGTGKPSPLWIAEVLLPLRTIGVRPGQEAHGALAGPEANGAFVVVRVARALRARDGQPYRHDDAVGFSWRDELPHSPHCTRSAY